MTAPTEAEIREAIRRRLTIWPHDNPMEKVLEGIDALFDIVRPYGIDHPDPFTEELPGPGPYDLWQDLKPSEERRRREIHDLAVERAEARVRELLEAEIVAAALLFASEFPDVRRVEWEPVPA